ncbi:hypothetical protein ERJ75_001720900 [Trypanosoma vivax]|nr:hypothetical protein ERJ75_001720900 [Trypanosoma vivax]
MVWPQCPTRRTADGERQRGARQQIARGKWNAKARGKDVRGRGDLGLTIEGGATRAGRSQAAAERRRSVVERRETRGCARGMLTMTAMSRVGKVAVRAAAERPRRGVRMCSQASAQCGETGTIGKARVLVCDGDWRAKTKEKNSRAKEEMRGRTESHDPGSKRTCERNEVWWHCTGSDCPGQEDSLGRRGQGSVPASTAKCDAGADKGARKAGAAVSVLPVLSKGKAGECARDAVGRDAGASSFCAEEVSCVRKCLRDDDACATTRQR